MKKKSTRIKSSIDDDLEHLARNIATGARNELSDVAIKYMECVVDPKRSKAARIPTLLGGEPGLTSVVKMRVEISTFIGTQGFGFVEIKDPCDSGFYSDRMAGSYSQANYAGTVVSGNSAVLGISPVLLTTSPYTTSDTNHKSYRCVGMSLEVIPVSSALTQNGEVCLLEPPAHTTQVGIGYAEMANHTRSRVIRGAQLGSVTDKIVINNHPIGVEKPNVLEYTNPFGFHRWSIANATICDGCAGDSMVIGFLGTAGTEYRVEFTAIYEFRGKGIPNPRVSLTDSRGMNLALNAFRAKQLSGWIGKPQHVLVGYLASVAKAIQKVEPLKVIAKGKSIYEKSKSVLSSLGNLAGMVL